MSEVKVTTRPKWSTMLLSGEGLWVGGLLSGRRPLINAIVREDIVGVRTQNYKYGGLQTFHNETVTMSLCFCGNSYGKHGKSDQCNMPCPPNNDTICGGTDANTVVTIAGQYSRHRHRTVSLGESTKYKKKITK